MDNTTASKFKKGDRVAFTFCGVPDTGTVTHDQKSDTVVFVSRDSRPTALRFFNPESLTRIATPAQLARARAEYAADSDGEICIDDNAPVSVWENGDIFVQAWVLLEVQA